jgi:predicted nucleotidyltransferase
MGVAEVLNTHREEIRRIASRYGARNLRVFGSVARGDAGPDSDVDVLVEMSAGRTLLDVVAIKQDIEDLLGRRVDVMTEAALSPYLRDTVLREAVQL